MSSGLPDFYRGVDVAYQALSEMIVRPKYGGALFAYGSVAVGAGVVTTLVTIAGKGMVYGGAVWLDYTSSQANSEVMPSFDGNVLSMLSFFRLREYALRNPRTLAVSLNKYDSANYVYSVGLSYGLTFEESLALRYMERHDGTPTVHYRIIYALI